VSVEIDVFPPDKRVRDLDNILKPLLDAMTAAGCWHDDSQVANLRVTRRGVVSGGRVDVVVQQIEPMLF
jgi:crossover junction endodeoxyribonuclease RusA